MVKLLESVNVLARMEVNVTFVLTRPLFLFYQVQNTQ